MRTRRWSLLIAAFLVGGTLEGLVVLAPDEVGVVYRFGKIDRQLQSGLHFRMPWPIESHITVAHTELRTLPIESQRLLTGDSSLIDLTLSVQYTVSNPVDFILGSTDPAATVSQVVQSASTRAAAATDIDTMIDNRGVLQDQIRILSQADLDGLKTGIRIETIDVRDLVPPPAVVDAFNDVSSSKSDRETTELAAQAYARKRGPEARGRASEIQNQAESWRAERLSQVDQEISRFEKLQAQHEVAPEGTELLLRTKAQADIGERARVLQAVPGTSLVLSLEEARAQSEDDASAGDSQ